MIPCIENKCLKYPVCINKSNITCMPLMQYFSKGYDAINEDTKSTNYNNSWLDLNKYLPSLNYMIATPVDVVSIGCSYSSTYLRDMNKKGQRFHSTMSIERVCGDKL